MRVPRADFESQCLTKLDALGWDYGFSVEFEGRRVGVRCDCQEVLNKLLSVAKVYGSIVDEEICESLISVKKARESTRRGVRHYNILYYNHNVQLKSFEMDEIFALFEELMKRVAVVLTDHFVHIDDSRLFAWEADDRLISVVGPDTPCRAVVRGLRPFMMPERTTYTSIAEDGTVPFSPWDLRWRGRLVQPPTPLTDLVFLLEEGQKPLGKGEAVLRLYELSSGKLPAEKRISALSSALQKIRVHSLPIGDHYTLAQRFADALGLDVVAQALPETLPTEE